MAESDKQGFYIYRLTFGNTITNPSTDIDQLSLEQGVRKEFADENNVSYYLILQGVKVNRKIYQPTEIEAELMIMDKTTNTSGTTGMKAPSFKSVSALLLQRQVTVDLLHVDSIPDSTSTPEYKELYSIAKNCYVYELNPLLKHEVNGTKMYVKINIFSMDKLMTLNKYSKAYVARKLGSEILFPESLGFAYGKGDPLVETSYEGQQLLQYQDNNKLYEFIQPYLVQYNESFYDFMVRTSNRCGEFLYFENGKLTLGLPKEIFKEDAYEEPDKDPKKPAKKVPLKIKDYESVTMQSISVDPLDIKGYARDSVKERAGDLKPYTKDEQKEIQNSGRDFKDNRGEDTVLNQTVINAMSNGFPLEAFPPQMSSNSEVATDEYIFPLYKDKFTSVPREMYYYGDGNDIAMFQAMKAGKTIFGNTIDSYGGIAASLAIGTIVDHGIQAILSKLQTNTVNKAKNDAFIESLKNKPEQYDGNQAVQFSNLQAPNWSMLDYYNEVYKYQVAQQRQIICINMGTNFVDVKLGQKIIVDGLSDNYVVIQIQQISEEAWSRDYEKYDTRSSDKYTGKRSLKIYAIPSFKRENVEYFIPPAQPVPMIRKVGPQTAFVTANEDPKFQGRVRIAYPWQSEGSGLKMQVAVAEQKLKAIEADLTKVRAEKNEALDLMTAMKNDVDDLKKYVKATDEKREQMLSKRTGESATLKADLEELEAKRTKQKTELDNLEMAEPQDDAKIAQQKFLLEQTEKQIKEKQAKKDHADQMAADLKAAAAEHDRKNGKDPYYKEVEQDNTIIYKYKSAYNNQRKKYNEKVINFKRVKKEKEMATDVKNQKTKAFQQKIDEMSTPWIRVATPMATPGGGSFYRPRIGDEVLVNYDCDNVERPYVVGSLFSKNVLTPDERYYRKQSPEIQWKNVSMAISSPNGHHISFTDPPGGGSFISNLISPGLGFYGAMVGFNDIAKGGKDLAGGIHIGDRYGLYEIQMQSHKRAIDIKSPFGTVNINAFTGITISAPNGDVTIKGKNITLEAGNKVTINSGTNLPQPGCGEQPKTSTKVADITKLIIEGVGNAVTGQFASSIVDLSTIRHIIEVFVRPVDGTTLIKSRKFLRLEAGLGNATIKRNNYKESTETSQEKEQEFYKALCVRVKFLNDQLSLFLDNYESIYSNFYACRNKYRTIMKRLFEDDKHDQIPNFATKAKEKVASRDTSFDFQMADYNSMLKDHVRPIFFYNGNRYNSDEEKFEVVKPAIMDYYRAAYDIQYHCTPEHFKGYLVYDEGGDYDWLTQAMKKTAEGGWISEQVNNWQNVFDDEMAESDDLNCSNDPYGVSKKNFFRRSFLLLYLKNVYDSPENKVEQLAKGEGFFAKLTNAINVIKEANTNYKYIYIGYKEADVTNPDNVDLNVDYWWKRQVKVIDRWNQNSWLRAIWDSTAKNLIGAAYDNTIGMFKKETDRQVWNSDLNGQILFSDKEDSTLSFEGEGLHKETDANQGNIAHLKWILRDM